MLTPHNDDGIIYLVEDCPPYDLSGCYVSLAADGGDIAMSGKHYTNGITFDYYDKGHALFNLDGEYSSIEFDIGHTGYHQDEKVISFIVDGNLVQTVTLEAECLPKSVSVPVANGLQLKIQCADGTHDVGLGNIIAK